MKKSLLIPVILSSVMFMGCSSAPEKAPENAPVEQPQPEPEPAPQPDPEPAVALPTEMQWRMQYSAQDNPDVMALYERARKLVEEQRGEHGKLNLWGSYFGPWFVVVFEPEPIDPEFVALDAPPPVPAAYLVDMAAGKVIDRGDWKTARPFIEAQIAAYRRGFKDDKARQEFLNFFAASVSVIAFGNTDYLEDNGSSYPDPISAPRLKTNPETSELTYYQSSHGMTLFYTECKLTVTHAAIVFNSEIVQPH
ncbi:MAG: hypothetical protein IJU23_06000 [Proteobacteria bacterium]|nr:hypothetical protein [Pseudomonadota bacterium]